MTMPMPMPMTMTMTMTMTMGRALVVVGVGAGAGICLEPEPGAGHFKNGRLRQPCIFHRTLLAHIVFFFYSAHQCSVMKTFHRLCNGRQAVGEPQVGQIAEADQAEEEEEYMLVDPRLQQCGDCCSDTSTVRCGLAL